MKPVVRQENEDIDRLIKRFKRASSREKIKKTFLNHCEFKSGSQKRREKKRAAIRLQKRKQ